MKVSTLEKLSIESIKLSEGVNDNKLILQIKAIHNGMTRNLTSYTSEALKGSLDSWTQPYQKKVLKNHDIDCEPLGRILAATYEYDENAHKDAVILTAEITDQDAIQKIMDKRYTTVSVGGSSNSVVCSICGTDLAKEGLCEHYKGEMYDGQLAYWIINNFDPDEVSFVNAPADIFAGVEDVIDDPMQKPQMATVFSQSAAGSGTGLKESQQDKGGQAMTIEELQAKLAEAETAKTTAEAAQVAAEAAKVAAETALTEKTAELETKTAEAADSASKLEEANNSVSQLTEQVNTLTAENTTLKESNETLTNESGVVKAEKEALETQVVEVRSENHKLVAEKVATAKLFLGKITKESFDTEVEDLIKRTVESLNDSMDDLVKEVSTVIVEKLEDPTKNHKEIDTHESKEFESKNDYSEFLGSEISKLFK